MENKEPTSVTIHNLSLLGQEKMQVLKPGTLSLTKNMANGQALASSDLSLSHVSRIENDGSIAPRNAGIRTDHSGNT